VLSRLLDRNDDHVHKLVRQRRVQIGESEARPGDRVKAGDLVTVRFVERERAAPLPNRRIRLSVVHEDEHVLVVRKPSGLAMHPGPGHGSDTMLNALLARNGPQLRALGDQVGFGFVHRLDRGTSGLVVVALTREAASRLVQQFVSRTVEKIYLALVHGRAPREGRLEDEVGGKEAVTLFERLEWRQVEEKKTVALLRVRPLTGRTHQIRIHFATMGHPVVGDRRYGKKSDPVSPSLHTDRLCLHATSLAFDHPDSGERLCFEWPLPGPLRRAFGKLQEVGE
jgi:23S rRNA pseudouridine1911/1915/1917 synthase